MQESVCRLQFGGERGYGWGNVKALEVYRINGNHLFGKKVKFQEKEGGPSLSMPACERLLAHAEAEGLDAAGDKIEPLVGREWRSDLESNRYAGQSIVFNKLCFAPGSSLKKSAP